MFQAEKDLNHTNTLKRRGAVALWLERKTLIHEVVGSSPGSGVSAPQIRGSDLHRGHLFAP